MSEILKRALRPLLPVLCERCHQPHMHVEGFERWFKEQTLYKLGLGLVDVGRGIGEPFYNYNLTLWSDLKEGCVHPFSKVYSPILLQKLQPVLQGILGYNQWFALSVPPKPWVIQQLTMTAVLNTIQLDLELIRDPLRPKLNTLKINMVIDADKVFEKFSGDSDVPNPG